jgi:hypothetical protein
MSALAAMRRLERMAAHLLRGAALGSHAPRDKEHQRTGSALKSSSAEAKTSRRKPSASFCRLFNPMDKDFHWTFANGVTDARA